jgi:polyhydroxyalkanoate synthase
MKEAVMDASERSQASNLPAVAGVSASAPTLPSRLRAALPAIEPIHHEIDADTARGETIDRFMHAWQGRFTNALSPGGLMLAYFDWAIHLANAPGKRSVLVEKAMRKWLRLALYASTGASGPNCPPCIEPLPQDRRFAAPEWQRAPFNLIYQNFLLSQQWWHNAMTGIRGVSASNEDIVSFATRQLLDIASPSNYLPTNPELLAQTVREGGQNLVRGFNNFLQDWERAIAGKKPVGTEYFAVGRNLATTPGAVVFRNELIELIQYAPATPTVHAEPILIVPAWIMKYYILDLSPENSLVRHIVGQGFTVLMISWRNPGAEQRDRGMDDYHRLGIDAALDAIAAICPARKIHACGYCLGGTLLAMAAAAMARDGDDRLASMTLFAAQTDFTEAGELTLFTNESEVAYLEDTMWEQGYLDGRQMSGAFQLLRSNDLVWSQLVTQYLKGERPPMTDLMAWNADTTRMPCRMQSEYLRHLFLGNDLAEGRFLIDGRPIALTDIRVPIFTVATETDHVAPWRSVYKIELLTDTEVTFVLTTGGHNAGLVSEPGHSHRAFRIAAHAAESRYIDPQSWVAATPSRDGSWWPAWVEWLAARSSECIAPRSLGTAESGFPPLAEAPGSYVLDS